MPRGPHDHQRAGDDCAHEIADDLEACCEKLVSSDRAELTNEVERYVLARFGVPVHDVAFVPRIPRTTSGKVKRDLGGKLYFDRRD